MAKEIFPQKRNQEDIGIRIDKLLNTFPEENHSRVLERIEGLSEDEQLQKLTQMARQRQEALKPRYRSERLRTISSVPESVIRRFEQSRNQIEVGRGENGRVFEFQPPEESEGGTSVFKMLIRPPMPVQNDLLTEAAYQADMAAFADTHVDTQIGVPHPYYIAVSDRGHVLAMEKVPGYSIEQSLRHNIPFPENFDYDRVQAALEEFVARMNREGFYHRDLREGNIVIDPDARPGNPIAYVIDFGFCTKASSREEAYRELDGLQDHVMIKKVMDMLRRKQELLKKQGV